jgi:hypothetical protein
MANHFYQYPSIIVTGAAEAATAANGSASLPALLKIIAGWDGTNIRVIKTDALGNVVISPSAGESQTETVRNEYGVTPVTTGAWVTLVASLASAIKALEIFDSSGQTLEIGIGGIGSEVRQLLVFPGGNGKVPCIIPSSTRVSIRAVSANASVGEIDINFYG